MKKKTGPKHSPFSVQHWIEKGQTLEEATFTTRSFRKTNNEYWIKRGYSLEESIEKVKEFQSEQGIKGNKVLKENPHLNSTRIEYYLHKGMSEEEAKQALSDRQKTFSLEICIEKYGEIEGTKIFNDRQTRWQNSLSKLDQDELNAKKDSFKMRNGEYKEEFCLRINSLRNTNLVPTLNEFKEIIKTYFEENPSKRYMPKELKRNLFPKTQYEILEIENPESLFNDYNREGVFLAKNKIGIKGHRLYLPNGKMLRSLYEMYFYDLLNEAQIKFEIEKWYPNSRMRCDFYLNETKEYIEICPLYLSKDKEYKEKMDYKKEHFGAILLYNEKEFKDFVRSRGNNSL